MSMDLIKYAIFTSFIWMDVFVVIDALSIESKLCPDKCPKGQVRNVSQMELTREEQGDHVCPPCMDCPKGTFAVNFNNDCQSCDTTKCTRYHRNVIEDCSTFNDVTCGSCNSGFFDEYMSLDFPCSPVKSQTESVKKEMSQNGEQQASMSSNIQILDHNSDLDKTTDLRSKGTQKIGLTNNTVAIIIISSVLVLLLAAVTITVAVYIKRRIIQRTLQVLPSFATQTQPERGNLIHNNDREEFEVDGPGDTLVRAETALESSVHHALHQELSQTQDAANGPTGIRNSTTEYFSRISNQVCRCDCTPCNACRTYYTTLCNEKVKRGDPIISLVSSNVCHNPLQLFYELGIRDAVIYQVDDDRVRNPDRISQKECIQRTLNMWLENETVDLVKLSEALCVCSFHHINDKIRQYEKVIQGTSKGNDSDSIASMMSY